MPFGDGTGPRGMGSMTGRGAGYCAGSDRPGFASQTARRGWFGINRGVNRLAGRGRGRGSVRRGFNRFASFPRW